MHCEAGVVKFLEDPQSKRIDRQPPLSGPTFCSSPNSPNTSVSRQINSYVFRLCWGDEDAVFRHELHALTLCFRASVAHVHPPLDFHEARIGRLKQPE